MRHRRLREVDLQKAADDVRAQAMADLGLRRIEMPFKAVFPKEFEWETRYEACGIRVLYVAPAAVLSVTRCDRCLS